MVGQVWTEGVCWLWAVTGRHRMLRIGTEEFRRPKARAEELGEPRLGRSDSYGLHFLWLGTGLNLQPHYNIESYACGSSGIAKAPYYFQYAPLIYIPYASLIRLTSKPGIGRDGDNMLRRRRKILGFEITKLIKLDEIRVNFPVFLCIWRHE